MTYPPASWGASNAPRQVRNGAAFLPPASWRVSSGVSNEAKYGGALANGVDLSLISSYDGIELLITINQPGASEFAFELELNGLAAELTGPGHILLKDSTTGGVWGHIKQPFAIDGNGDFTADVSYTLTPQASKYLWRVSVSPQWLGAPGRAYPVVIDPWMSFRGDQGGEEHGLQDVMIHSGYPNTCYEGWYNYVGQFGGTPPPQDAQPCSV